MSHASGARSRHTPPLLRGCPPDPRQRGAGGRVSLMALGPSRRWGGHLLRVACLHGADLRPHSPWGGRARLPCSSGGCYGTPLCQG